MKLSPAFIATLTVGVTSAAYSGDVVQFWIDQTSIFLNETLGIQQRGLQTPATCWNFAIVSATMYNAAVKTEDESLSYQQVAVSYAAHNALTWLFHGARWSPYVDNALKMIQTAILASGDAVNINEAGTAGQDAANEVFVSRSTDGLDNFVDYKFGPEIPGVYQLTLSGYGLPPDGPQIPYVKLFSNSKLASSYLAPLPPSVNDSSYESYLTYVKAIGSANSTTRTPDQTDIALFWREGAPTKWNRIAGAIVANTLATDVQTAAKLCTQLNYAMFNGAVASWVPKWHYNSWRPVTAINRTDIWLVSGRNISDPSWESLLQPTPIEQEYTSGRSTVGAAAGAVLKAYNKGDAINITVSSVVGQPPSYVSTRHYNNITEAAVEIGTSRVYGGIHFTFSVEAGFTIGTQVGTDTLASFDKLWAKF